MNEEELFRGENNQEVDFENVEMADLEEILEAEEEAPAENPVAELEAKITELEDQVARSRAETYNVSQDYSRYVQRSKKEAATRREEGRVDVLGSLLPVLDDIEAARAHGDLESGPFASIADKLVDTLQSQYGFEQYGEEGEAFDPELHEALMANTTPDVDEPVISKVVQSGYRSGDDIIRVTKVIVDQPE